MIARLIQDASLSEISELVSPSFFQVMPPRTLRRQLGGLAANLRRRGRFEDLRQRRAADLSARGAGLRLLDRAASRFSADLPATPAGRQRRGEALLSLYFRQLLDGPDTLLDLRSAAFQGPDDNDNENDAPVAWAPAALWVRWDPDFIAALRLLYRGFYDGDHSGDGSAFDRACAAMNLSAARPVLLDHFGGDQSAVVFDPTAFRRTFHKVFLACRDAGDPLPGGFVPLGLYLGTLYEHMDRLGGAWDVRAAWRAAFDAEGR